MGKQSMDVEFHSRNKELLLEELLLWKNPNSQLVKQLNTIVLIHYLCPLSYAGLHISINTWVD
jgi:hypothetical protein